MKRVIYRVRWLKAEGKWTILLGKTAAWEQLFSKQLAIKFACNMARNQPKSQVVVYNKSGRIAFERTYGSDPRRYKG